jgi:hypothetical protein
MIVTIGIFTLLSTTVIANFRSVDNTLVLRNVAYQVAVIVRKAQIFGISNKGINNGAGVEVFPVYGASFETGVAGTPPANTRFTLFADFPTPGGNLMLNGGCPSSECVQRYLLRKGYTIQNLYINRKTSPPGISRDRIDVTFTRPNPDATFRTSPVSAGVNDAEIVIRSPGGSIKTIIIWKTGQISVE